MSELGGTDSIIEAIIRAITPHNPSTTLDNRVAIWSIVVGIDRITGTAEDSTVQAIIRIITTLPSHINRNIGRRSNDPEIILAVSTNVHQCVVMELLLVDPKDPVVNEMIPSTRPRVKCLRRINSTLIPHLIQPLSAELPPTFR